MKFVTNAIIQVHSFGTDGKIYAIPENINNVMVIALVDEPSVEMIV